MSLDNNEAFFTDPTFEVSSLNDFITECSTCVPTEMRADWEKGMDVDLFAGSLQLISQKSAKWKYQMARSRYLCLTKLMPTGNDESKPWRLLLLVLAEANFWLSDLLECKSLLCQLRELHANDTNLNRIIELLQEIIESDAALDEEYHAQKDFAGTVHYFSTPVNCPEQDVDIPNLRELQGSFEKMQRDNSNAVDEFARYACLSSNVIEGVFSLEGSSWPRLVRRGFFVNSIEGISRDSKLKKKTTIIRVLENTLEALNKMSTSLDDFALFTPEFLMELHRMLLQNDNFVIEEVDEYTVYQVIPLGKFRVRACITEHGEDEDVRVTQFCHPSLICTEMERYCKLARCVLANDSIDVFMKTAWLQWAFLRIHPFADGNGRISRIISSIPLCKLGLPPVVVTMACKPVYFAALHQADTEKNLLPLSAFLRSSILETITEIASLPTDAVLSAGKTQARIRITPRVRRGSESSSSSSGKDSPV